MRTLTVNEIENVAGCGPDTVLWVLFGLTAVWMASSMSPSYAQPKVVYEPVVTSYDVITPVYNAYGQYVGDMVDTYTQTDYVPVTVY